MELSHIFGHGGARIEAQKLSVPFLGGVPLHMDIRETSDSGTPIVVSQPEGVHAQIFKDMASKVRDQILESQSAQAAPKIIFE